MPLTIKPSSGSGSATLVSVTGTTTNDTLTLPAKTGNIITSADSGTVTQTMLGTNVAGNGPAFMAYAGATTSLSQNAYTKVLFNTTEQNQGSAYSTANSTFTPAVAGFYQINAMVELSNSTSGYVNAAIYKNGVASKNGPTNTNTGPYRVALSSLIYFNGSTDYIDIRCFVNVTGLTTQAYDIGTWFNGYLARAA